MQAGKNQMSGFRCCHGCLDRLVITHFTKKDHIGALAECGTKGSEVAFSICADLSLADDALVMAVQIFQRILKSDDVSFSCVVDPVDQAGHSGGFSAAGRTCHKNHSTCIVSSAHNILRNQEFSRIRQTESNDTDNSGKRTTLLVGVDTESGNAGNGKRKIIVAGFQKT